ncbi:MAG: hemolysin family protein [Lachnospiraceae bacterium]|nr:hemolysin family protein [Lachnospiraceae bacterium]
MDPSGYIQLFILLILLYLSSFFSAAETALTTVNLLHMRTIAEDPDDPRRKAAARIVRLRENHSKMLSTILIGNNIINLSSSALATTFTIHVFGEGLIGIATALLTLLVIIFGEIIPKTSAMRDATRVALRDSVYISALMILLTPVIFLVNKLADLFLKLLPAPRETGSITEGDLRTYVDVGHEEGVLESEEHEMITNVFDLSSSKAEEVMIPRIDMIAVPKEATYDEVLSTFRTCMYTRIPVYEGDSDHIIGLINVKDFLLVDDKKAFRIDDILRDAYYTYESKVTSDLMTEMRENSYSVAFVLNEYSATVGMITLEDLLEEIVGEIRDEYDADETTRIQQVYADTYLIEANVKLADVNDELDIELESEDYDTIGGIMMDYLDRLPRDGETITTKEGVRLKANGIENNRIVQVLLTLPKKEEAEKDEAEKDKEKEKE